MRFGSVLLVSGAVLLAACSKNEDGIESGSDAVTAGPTAREGKIIKVGNLTLEEKVFSGKAKAQNPPDEFFPELDSCETNATYFQISGTQHDAEINKILRGEWQEPTTANCEFAETFDQTATLRGIDPEQGLLSIVEFESFFSGGAHPNNGTEFKQIDLRTGKLLSLGDYVKADATDKLKELVKHKIETQKVKVEVDAPRFDRAGQKRHFEIKLLDPENQEMMKGFADSYFTSFDANSVDEPAKPSDLHDFTIAGTGIRIDLSNTLPHALGGMDASYKLLWNDLETAGVLRTDTDLIERTKAARPKQRTATR